MKWVSVNTGASNEIFELWNGDRKLANISFSNRTCFLRRLLRMSMGSRWVKWRNQGPGQVKAR
jgi:hypothetical protein